MYLGSCKFLHYCKSYLSRNCCSQLWLPSFYVCEACYQTLVIVHTFREKCIASDLARKVLENKLSVDNHLNTEKYSQCKEESFRTEELKNEIEGGSIRFIEISFLTHLYAIYFYTDKITI